MKVLFISERVLTTLWVGGMWIIGYLVAPLLFSVVDERQLAGFIAGHIFSSMNYVGLVCGSLLLVGNCYKVGLKNKVNYLLIAMLVLVAISQFVLQPMMADLKSQGLAEGTEAAIQFGRLHGVSSVLFMLTSIAGLILILSSPRERTE